MDKFKFLVVGPSSIFPSEIRYIPLEDARKVVTYMWGKDLKKYAIYKLVSLPLPEVANVSTLEEILEQ